MEGRRGLARSLALVLTGALLAAACGGQDRPPAGVVRPDPRAVAHPAATPVPTATPLYRSLRVFVVAEGPYWGGTGELHVLGSDGRSEFATLARIPMGGWPHNVAVSPDGRWVAVADRSSSQVSIVDPIALVEVARVAVGKQPHALLWHPDGSVLYVGAEKETFITRLEAGTWRALPPLQVGVRQHAFAMRADRPNELWFTVTMDNVADHTRVYDLATGKITAIKAFDVHDLYFTPDGSEVWSSSSGFLDKPSDRLLVYDPIEKVVKGEVRFPGHYPFHTLKRLQDGMYHPKDTSVMLLSSHYSMALGRKGASLLWVDWKARTLLDETPVGAQPFHSTYDPIGERVMVTTNGDGMVNVIDWNTHRVLQKIPVPKPHGIVAVGIP